MTVGVGYQTAVKSYDDQGFLITTQAQAGTQTQATSTLVTQTTQTVVPLSNTGIVAAAQKTDQNTGRLSRNVQSYVILLALLFACLLSF
jgi:hypothetical protein